MKSEFQTIRTNFLIASVLFIIASILVLYLALRTNIWYLALLAVFIFLVGLVLFIFSLFYSIIYKTNLEIDEIEEKKNRE